MAMLGALIHGAAGSAGSPNALTLQLLTTFALIARLTVSTILVDTLGANLDLSKVAGPGGAGGPAATYVLAAFDITLANIEFSEGNPPG